MCQAPRFILELESLNPAQEIALDHGAFFQLAALDGKPEQPVALRLLSFHKVPRERDDVQSTDGTPMPTSEHPIQSFQWEDYTAKPATIYRYKVVPVYGKPKLIELDDASATTVEITTECEEARVGDDGQPCHDIYFNRGAAGSQAYARKFPNKPDETKPKSDQMVWLSRGLFEALTTFIGRAAGNDGSDYKLRAMFVRIPLSPGGASVGCRPNSRRRRRDSL